MARHYYLVGVTQPTGGAGLTYHAERELAVGQLVEVSLRQRRMAGVILSSVPKPSFTTKAVERVLDLAALPPQLVELGDWLWHYYACDAAAAWQTIIPAGALKTRRATTEKSPTKSEIKIPKLTGEQTTTVQAIASSDKTTILLRGVTGAGKTEVYLEIVTQTLAAGRSSIILVPEIALTPQTEARFRTRFGNQVLLTHSGLTEAQRFRVWRQVLESSDPQIVVGPRSALFLPIKQLGLIVIDECHESSYKQEQAPRYEAAIVAAKLAHLHQAKLLLGSATPGLREAFLAKQGVIKLVELRERYNQIAPAPPIIVDLKDPSEFRGHKIFSQTLLSHLDETLERGRQALLFLNRRGSASSQLCTNCQHVTLCPRCRLPLTFHADRALMLCHICNYSKAPTAVCSNCGLAELRFLGLGTKRVEDELHLVFPKARVMRLDKDSLNSTNLDQLYQDLNNHQIDVLIGTQMIAKGLDLPAMETVGVVLADTSLYLPDYSATERTYNLLTQVSGRAGRGSHPGRTIIQTYSPNHQAIAALAHDDYWRFANGELSERQELGYPPYYYLLKLSYSHKSEATAKTAGIKLARDLSANPNIIVTGPAPAFRQFASGQNHWQIIAKSRRRQNLIEVARQVPTGWTSDLDPINLL
ncbi:MAG TPA: primosomal protein N' [Candidatus Saccharimonadales bacterium]|nr:primosomal protein N' [Candidatus Saccharimonadales bacterium]